MGCVPAQSTDRPDVRVTEAVTGPRFGELVLSPTVIVADEDGVGLLMVPV